MEHNTPTQIRQLYFDNPSERTLASAYAVASNTMFWLIFDLDEPDCTKETELEFQAWADLEEELRNIIFDILKKENNAEFEHQTAKNTGYHAIIMPFMVRNGYMDRSGWWSPQEQTNRFCGGQLNQT